MVTDVCVFESAKTLLNENIIYLTKKSNNNTSLVMQKY